MVNRAEQLQKNNDGTFVLHFQNGNTIQFNINLKPYVFSDSNGNTVTLTYVGNDVTTIRHSDGDQIVLIYNSDGRITNLIDPNGDVTTYTYNANNTLLESVTAPDGKITRYSYLVENGFYAISKIIRPGNVTERYSYDDSGRLIESISNNNKNTLTFKYDTENRITAVTDGVGSALYVYVNENGQVTTTEDSKGSKQQYLYNSNNDPIKIINALGDSYLIGYDNKHNPTLLTDPLGNNFKVTYNNKLNLINSITRGNGISYNFSFDDKFNLLGITFPDGISESNEYNSNGNLVKKIKRSGDAITLEYNIRGEVSKICYPDNTYISYTYDNSGNIRTATNIDGTISIDYNRANQPIAITYPDSSWFKYTYNDIGLLSERIESNGFITDYGYDNNGNLISVSNNAIGTFVKYQYDSEGKIIQKDLRNGGYSTYSYDTIGQISKLVNYNQNGSILSQFEYSYDNEGNPISINTIEGLYQYNYDNIGQLVAVTYPDGNKTQYLYDPSGNRISVIDNSKNIQYTTNTLEQYDQVGNITFSYDKNGNLLSKTENDNKTLYSYNYENQLTKVTSPSGIMEYQYDALGNQVGVMINGIYTRYSVDPTEFGNIIAEYNENGTLISHFNQGLGLISKVDQSGNEYEYYFNPSGNTMEITNSSGNVVNFYQYSPFGEYIQRNEKIENPFTFNGEDGVIAYGNNLYYMQMRSYLPEIGRFTSLDPTGVFLTNPYSFTNNNPIRFIDPFGLMNLKITAGASLSLRTPYSNPGLGAGSGGFITIPNIAVLNSVKYLKYGTILGGPGVGATAMISYLVYHATDIGPLMYYQATQSILGGGGIDSGVAITSDLSDDPPKSGLEFSQGCAVKLGGWGIAADYTPETKVKSLSLLIGPGGKLNCQNAFTYTALTDFKLHDAFNSLWLRIRSVLSIDPEDKYGPSGYDPLETTIDNRQRFINSSSPFDYRVDFWNAENATANVVDVSAYDQLDTNLDYNTFGFTEVGFTNWSIPLYGTQSFDLYVDTRPEMNYRVHIIGGLNPNTGNVTLQYHTLDADTLQPPEDPVAGFLPPISSSGKEVGWFAYSVNPKPGLATGTVIENRAWINFDNTTFMPAPPDAPWKNTIDARAPTTSVTATLVNQTEIYFELSGSEDAGGSGIKDYTIYGSDNGGAYTPYLNHIVGPSGSTSGIPGHTYRFYSLGRNNVGNIEAAKSSPDSTVFVPVPVIAPSAWFAASPNSGSVPLTVTFSDRSSNDPTEWDWNFGDGTAWVNGTTKEVTHTYNSTGHYTASLRVSNSAGPDTAQQVIEVTNASKLVAAFTATPSAGVAPLSVTFADTSSGNPSEWKWSFGDGQSFNTTNSVERNTSHTYNNPGQYIVNLTVANGKESNTTFPGTSILVTSSTGPGIVNITPNTGISGSKVSVTNLAGYNFKSVNKVKLSRSGYPNITASTVRTVSSTKITCSFNLNGATAGLWDVIVTNPDGQSAILSNGFNVTAKNPSLSTVTPTSGYRNSTNNFVITGTAFQNGAVITFTNSTYTPIIAVTNSPVSSTKITGRIDFPVDNCLGIWDVTVTNPDGKTVTKKKAFTVKDWPTPIIKTVAPTSGYKNITIPFSLSGTGFEPGIIVHFINDTYPGGNVTGAVSFVSLSKIAGNLTIPSDAPTGKWNIVVITPDGGQSPSKTGVFTVKNWPKPTVSSITPTSGTHGTSITFTVKGNNFQPGSVVAFTNSSVPTHNFTTAVSSISMTKIMGSTDIPIDRMGKFNIEVRCPDGQIAKKSNGFTVI